MAERAVTRYACLEDTEAWRYLSELKLCLRQTYPVAYFLESLLACAPSNGLQESSRAGDTIHDGVCLLCRRPWVQFLALHQRGLKRRKNVQAKDSGIRLESLYFGG